MNDITFGNDDNNLVFYFCYGIRRNIFDRGIFMLYSPTSTFVN